MYTEIVLGGLMIRYHPRPDGPQETGGARFRTLRRIEVPLPRGTWVPMFLHWSDGTDLDELDRRMSTGEPGYRWFTGSLPGSDMPLRCRACRAEYVAVVADAGTPLVPDLPARLRAHAYVPACPACGTRWQPHVMYAAPVAEWD